MNEPSQRKRNVYPCSRVNFHAKAVYWQVLCWGVCTKYHQQHVSCLGLARQSAPLYHLALDVAISACCNSVRLTFPRQRWMAWLCVTAQRASNPNRNKISLFLSRLHNGSGGGEGEKKSTFFSPTAIEQAWKPTEIWLQHLREASALLVGMTRRFVAWSPTARCSASLFTTNRLLCIYRAPVRENTPSRRAETWLL